MWIEDQVCQLWNSSLAEKITETYHEGSNLPYRITVFFATGRSIDIFKHEKVDCRDAEYENLIHKLTGEK